MNAARAIALTLAVALWGAHARAAGPAPAPEVFAILVGHNGAAPGLAPLRFADDDAVRFALLLRGLQRERGTGRAWLLTTLDDDTRSALLRAGLNVPIDGPPTRTAFARAFTELATALARPAPAAGRVLYVIYAGHGLGDRVVLQPEVGDQAALTGRELRAFIADATVHDPQLRAFLFIDACRAQSLFGERGTAGPDLAAEIAAADARAETAAPGVLAAAMAGKPAAEIASLHAGLFSYMLASALAGAADADGDDVVSFAEVAAFVAWGTRRVTGQMPWFAPPAGRLDAPTADHRTTRTRVVSAGAGRVHLRVEDATGRPLFAEAFKDGTHALRLALPPGTYGLWRDGLAGPQLARIVLAPEQTLTVDERTWSGDAPASAPRGEVPESVLEEPFGPGAVAALEAGWQSGRAPQGSASSPRWGVSLSGGLGGLPLGLAGAEPVLGVDVRRLGSGVTLGLRLRGGTSAHAGALGGYDVRRAGAMPALGYGWALGRRVVATPWAGAGVAGLWRVAEGERTRGDRFVPTLAAGGTIDVALVGRWFASADIESAWEWIDVDSRAEASHVWRATLGLGGRL